MHCRRILRPMPAGPTTAPPNGCKCSAHAGAAWMIWESLINGVIPAMPTRPGRARFLGWLPHHAPCRPGKCPRTHCQMPLHKPQPLAGRRFGKACEGHDTASVKCLGLRHRTSPRTLCKEALCILSASPICVGKGLTALGGKPPLRPLPAAQKMLPLIGWKHFCVWHPASGQVRIIRRPC